jgi:hypothetical protein
MTEARTCDHCGVTLEPLDPQSPPAHPIIAGVGVALVAVDSIWRCPHDGSGILVEELGDGTRIDHPFGKSHTR